MLLSIWVNIPQPYRIKKPIYGEMVAVSAWTATGIYIMSKSTISARDDDATDLSYHVKINNIG
jgi:hypothetical protein